jgi:hypothetical protein
LTGFTLPAWLGWPGRVTRTGRFRPYRFGPAKGMLPPIGCGGMLDRYREPSASRRCTASTTATALTIRADPATITRIGTHIPWSKNQQRTTPAAPTARRMPDLIAFGFLADMI